jgi:hypothetical protein
LRISSSGCISNGPADAGVVDQRRQVAAAQHRVDLRNRLVQRSPVGHVEHQRHEGLAPARHQPVGIGKPAHGPANEVAALQEVFGDGKADAGGNARDDDDGAGFLVLVHVHASVVLFWVRVPQEPCVSSMPPSTTSRVPVT